MTDAVLRAARRERVFAAMARADLDVLVLARRDAVAYATGAQGLWTAGTRPFGAACVLVSAGRSVHLLSTWDAGVPPDIPFEHLYGVTWNPAVMLQALQRIDGLATAQTLGVDALSPGFVRAARRLAPDAAVVPADDVVRRVRATKLPAEVERIRAATAVARDGVQAATAILMRDPEPAAARRAALAALAGEGATVPTSGVAVTAETGTPFVHVDVGILVDGYEGGLGRTVPTEPDGVATLQQEVVAACRPGTTGRDIRQAAAPATRWMVRGSGMGVEPPIITATMGGDAVVEAGMVLSVEVALHGQSRRDLVVVTPDTTDVL